MAVVQWTAAVMYLAKFGQRRLSWPLGLLAILAMGAGTLTALQALLVAQSDSSVSRADEDRERKWQIRTLCLAPMQDDFAKVDGLLNGLQDSAPVDDFVSMAAGARNIRIVEVLLRHGYPVDGPNHDNAPVFLAAHRDSEYVVSYLIQRGASLKVRPPKTDSPLAAAVTANRLGMTLTLLANGVPIDDEFSLWGHLDMTRYQRLMKSGVDCRHERVTPLALAVILDRSDMLLCLLNHGANAEFRTKAGLSITELAQRAQSSDSLRVLNRIRGTRLVERT